MKYNFFKRLISYALLFALLFNVVPHNIVYVNAATGGTVKLTKEFKTYQLGEMVYAEINVKPNVKKWIAYWMYDGKKAEMATLKTEGELNNDKWEMGTVNFPRYTGIYVEFYDDTGFIGSDKDTFSISSPVKTWEGHTYAVYDIMGMTWNEAKAFCERLGGYLATIITKEEQDCINNLVKNSTKSVFWLGASKENGAWEWITPEHWGIFTNWNNNTGQPDGAGNYLTMFYNNSVAYSALNYYWYDNDEYATENYWGLGGTLDSVGFICEWNTPNITPPLIQSFEGHTYQVFDMSMTWHEAQEYCESLGGHLVTIVSPEEQAFVFKLVESATRRYYFMGGYEDNHEWKWVNNDLFNYTNWEFDELLYYGNEYFLMMYKDYTYLNEFKPGKWNNALNETWIGAENYGFICEWDYVDSDISNNVIWDNPTSYGSYDNVEYHPASLWGLWGFSGNFMHSGMTIDKWNYKELSNDSVDITFTVYNSNATAGEILVYNDKNELVDCKIISAYQELPENIKEYIFDEMGELIKDFFALFGNMQKVHTAETEVKINIPKNGYMIIHNDANLSKDLSLLYIFDQVSRALSACSTVVSGADNIMSIDELIPILEDMSKQSENQKLIAEILLKSNDLLKHLSSDVESADKILTFVSLAVQIYSELALQDTDFVSFIVDLGIDLAGDKAEDKLKKFLYTSGVIPGLIYDSLFLTLGGFNFAYAQNDYKNTMSSGYVRIENFKPQIITRTACPVDVEITHKGETLSSANDTYNSKTSWGTLYLVGENYDTKVIALDIDVPLDIKITGTGEGTMDYSIEYLDSQEFYSVSDVPITENTKIVTTTVKTNNPVLEIDNNGDGNIDEVIKLIDGKIVADSYTITATAGTGGTAAGGGTFTFGEQVTLTATPNNGYLFDGWFEDNKLISNDKILTFTAEEDRELQARFTPKPTITTDFTDPNFLAVVRTAINKPTGDIFASDVSGITSLDVSGKNIASLAGIKHFTALILLDCYDNQLAALDVSNNTALVFLDCSDNQLTALDLSSNTAIIAIDCHNNNMTNISAVNTGGRTIPTFIFDPQNQIDSELCPDCKKNPCECPILIKGDLNGDGEASIDDAKLFLEYLVGNADLNEAQKLAADDFINNGSAIKNLRAFLDFIKPITKSPNHIEGLNTIIIKAKNLESAKNGDITITINGEPYILKDSGYKRIEINENNVVVDLRLFYDFVGLDNSSLSFTGSNSLNMNFKLLGNEYNFNWTMGKSSLREELSLIEFAKIVRAEYKIQSSEIGYEFIFNP